MPLESMAPAAPVVSGAPVPLNAPTTGPAQENTLRWEMRRPTSVSPGRWRQVMLDACRHGWIHGLQSFSIDSDTASLCVRGTRSCTDVHGRPAELAQALAWIDAELKRPTAD